MYLVLRAFWELARVQYVLSFRDLPAVYVYVKLGEAGCTQGSAKQQLEICRAIDAACIWFWKEISCLHRSAVTARLLKRHGVRAQMVIGAQSLPFEAHAWVEVDGRVVNDRPYVGQIYAELDRF